MTRNQTLKNILSLLPIVALMALALGATLQVAQLSARNAVGNVAAHAVKCPTKKADPAGRLACLAAKARLRAAKKAARAEAKRDRLAAEALLMDKRDQFTDQVIRDEQRGIKVTCNVTCRIKHWLTLRPKHFEPQYANKPCATLCQVVEEYE